MARPHLPATLEITEALVDIAETAEAAEHQASCVAFYGPHPHTPTEPFRWATRGPWWPAAGDFPGLETEAVFTAGTRTPADIDVELYEPPAASPAPAHD